ncbi:MAG: type 1 glutamine amidotransferase [Geobacteraceae bacterium]|nr:type 1 glutamine amidotransferase [Geobacteraceae bacterium]
MLVIVQNDPEVPIGAFNDYLAEAGVPFTVSRPYGGEALPPLGEVSAVIILGGAMGVHDTEKHPFLVPLKRFIVDCVQREVPFLGICLGGQLLADALGGRVISNSPHGEKGTLTVTLDAAGEADPLFAGIGREFVTFQWHNDSFETPTSGIPLASSAACPNQAFRCGRCAWGTQFHPEVDRAIVDAWSRWTKVTAPLAEQFLADFIGSEEAYRSASRRMLGNFLRIARLQ